MSSADPACTFVGLVGERELPEGFARALRRLDFRSPVFKVNLALRRLPEFRLRGRDSIRYRALVKMTGAEGWLVGGCEGI